MSFTLRQIEEKHTTGGLHDLCHRHGEPCDVVKLARALDDLLDVLDAHEPHEISTEGHRRVLEEVAGE